MENVDVVAAVVARMFHPIVARGQTCGSLVDFSFQIAPVPVAGLVTDLDYNPPPDDVALVVQQDTATAGIEFVDGV
jgi:hypothetical protein